jgi:hypothetical protein
MLIGFLVGLLMLFLHASAAVVPTQNTASVAVRQRRRATSRGILHRAAQNRRSGVWSQEATLFERRSNAHECLACRERSLGTRSASMTDPWVAQARGCALSALAIARVALSN